MPKPPRPTDAELAILSVLWARGPSTVREVHESLDGRETGYTTTLKLMQIMFDKGLVVRDESARSHVYKAHVSKTSTLKQIVNDVVDRAFGGSSAALVLQALSSRRATPDELREIERLIEEHKRKA